MYKKMIVATDLSAASDAVVGCLSGLKKFGTEECLLLQCLSFNDAASASFAYDTEPLDERLETQKETLEQQGFTVEARTVVGAPKHEIARIADKEAYPLIVVGTQGHSLAGEKLLGGVTYGVISKSAKPVLVVPIRKKEGDENTCEPVSHCQLSEHVLFATDFSETADQAFAHIEHLVPHGGKITLLHVQDKARIEKHLEDLEEFNKIDTERLERLKALLEKTGAKDVSIEVTYGAPKQEIANYVRENNVSLVVMGSQGRGFFGEMLLGSVSHAVARHSTVPVLLVPASA